jgi:predicted DsbA family dithiol-disulfide isomerase
MKPAVPGPVTVTHYSDVLCVWAYVAQIRLEELRQQFGAQVQVRQKFCSVFGDVETKVTLGWQERGGVPAFRAHVAHVISGFDHVSLHEDVWAGTVPTTSSSAHASVKAVELVTATTRAERSATEPTPAELYAWQLRLAFFRDGRDVSRLDVQLAVAAALGLPVDAMRARLEGGSAWAALLRDYEEARTELVRGSPTFVLNERRQVLYGNVGYKIIEANVAELLRHPTDQASWC